jgi:hypothetical protein
MNKQQRRSALRGLPVTASPDTSNHPGQLVGECFVPLKVCCAITLSIPVRLTIILIRCSNFATGHPASFFCKIPREKAEIIAPGAAGLPLLTG